MLGEPAALLTPRRSAGRVESGVCGAVCVLKRGVREMSVDVPAALYARFSLVEWKWVCLRYCTHAFAWASGNGSLLIE